MPKTITGTSQSAIDKTASVPNPGDISSSARFEETIQGLLNNDATFEGQLTGAYIAGLINGLTNADRIAAGGIRDDAINAEKLSAASGTVGQFLQLAASNGLSWATPLTVTKGSGITLSTTGNTNASSVSDGNVTIQINANAIVSSMINANAVTTAKIANDAITNAKIADDAVSADQLADSSVTEPKLSIRNNPTDGQVLEWDTTNGLQWTDQTGGSEASITAWSPADPTGTPRIEIGNNTYVIRLGKLAILTGSIVGRLGSARLVTHTQDFTLPVNQAQSGWVNGTAQSIFNDPVGIRVFLNPQNATTLRVIMTKSTTTQTSQFNFMLAYVTV